MISALVLAPLPLAAIWFGAPWLAAAGDGRAAVMAWEWGRLCQSGVWGRSGAVLIAIVVAAVIAAARRRCRAGRRDGICGRAARFRVGAGWREGDPLWIGFGAVWVAVPCVLLLWLARPETAGRVTVFWLFAVVWATDIGAYVIGRRLGGPRLAPRWSPSKTWAGLVGGVVCAAVVGWATALLTGAGAGSARWC